MALAAIAMSLLPFVLLEAGLRLFDIAGSEAEVHAGFGETSPLFEDGDGTYRTSVAKGQFFVSEEFSAEPKDGEFRIFVLGGSTVQGRPFSIDTSFAKWLELQLNAEDPGQRYQTINCGGISYASYRLRPVLREVLNYKPNLIVLATGHNEFLEDRTYASLKSRSGVRLWLESASAKSRTIMLLRRLFGGAPKAEPTQNDNSKPMGEVVETKLDDQAGYASYHRDPEWRDQVARQYQDSVRDMVKTCQAAKVPLVLVNLGANLRDCPPFKSELPPELSAEQQHEWHELFDLATRLQNKDWAAALDVYEQLLTIDPLHGLVHFRTARCLEQLGRISEASASYQRALDNDVCPLRMPGPLHELLSEVSTETNVPLVDAMAAVDKSLKTTDPIPGYDLYLDHVHPTIGAHQVIARAIAEGLREHQLVDMTSSNKLDENGLRTLYRSHLRSLPTAYFSNGRRRIGWLEGWAQRQRLFDETIPINNVGEVSATLRYLQLSDLSTARQHLLMATTDTDGVLRLLNSAAQLFQQGQTESANWILGELAEVADEEFLETIDMARLIIACDENNTAAMQRIFAAHENDWTRIVAVDQTMWHDTMPDVLDRTVKAL